MGSGGSRQFQSPQEEIEFLKNQVKALISEKEKEMRQSYEREMKVLKEEHEKKETAQDKIKAEYVLSLTRKDEKIDKLEASLKDAEHKLLQMVERNKSQIESVQKSHREEILRLESDQKKALEKKDEDIRRLRQDIQTTHQQALDGKDKHLRDVKEFHRRLDEEKGKEVKGKYIVNHTYLVEFPADAQFPETDTAKIMDSVDESAKSTLSRLGAKVVKTPGRHMTAEFQSAFTQVQK